MKILLVEDDKNTAEYIIQGLTEAGFSVDHFDIGSNGLYASIAKEYDAIILDRMLPEVDGLKIVKTLRSSNDQTPVIFLTAMSDVDERVEGLIAGADDYLTKPFAFSELLARIQNMIRRNNGTASQIESTLSIDDLTVNLIDRSVTRGNKDIKLKIKEFNILVYLLKNKGRIITRTMLLEQIWNYSFSPQTNVVDVHIFNLRKHVDEGFNKQLIKTIRGVGYKIDDE